MAMSLSFSVKYTNFKDATITIRVYASIRDQVYISLEKNNELWTAKKSKRNRILEDGDGQKICFVSMNNLLVYLFDYQHY